MLQELVIYSNDKVEITLFLFFGVVKRYRFRKRLISLKEALSRNETCIKTREPAPIKSNAHIKSVGSETLLSTEMLVVLNFQQFQKNYWNSLVMITFRRVFQPTYISLKQLLGMNHLKFENINS